MTTLTKPQTDKSIQATCIKKGQRSTTEIRYAWTRSPAGVPALTIASGKATGTYLCREFATGDDFPGRAFNLQKVDSSDAYNVFLAENGQDHLCDCFGQTAHGRCKHVSVLYASWQNGELPGDQPPVESHPSDEQVADEDFGAGGAPGDDCPF